MSNVLLRPFAYVYGTAVNLRNNLYDRGILRTHRAAQPVISIGNISAGGSGKTPFVRYLGERLVQSGKKPVILSRGYGGTTNEPVLVPPKGLPSVFGDEALMQAEYFGNRAAVVVSPRRIDGAAFARTKRFGELIILDDGFQHRALHRDLDLVLVDVTSGPLEQVLYGDKLLPEGRLRENPERALKRASALVLVTRSPAKPHPLEPGALPAVRFLLEPWKIRHLMTGDEQPLSFLQGMRPAAVAAIAQPEHFFAMLQKLGAELRVKRVFRDHHAFRLSDVEDLLTTATIVTEKDAVKLRRIIPPSAPFYYVELRGRFASPEDDTRFMQLLSPFI